MEKLSKSKFCIIGCGATGLSTLRFLEYMDWKIEKIFDTRKFVSNFDRFKNYKLYLGEFNIEDFYDIDIIIISPGVSVFDKTIVKLKSQGKMIFGDVELFARMIQNWNSKIIAITGSNGKTTVTNLVGEICKFNHKDVLIAGNIGVPVLDSYVDCIKRGTHPEVIVLELSSFQLETISSLNIDVATVLNISDDHLDRYNDLLEYAYIKSSIFNKAKIQILNINDELVLAMRRFQIKTIFFGKNINNYCSNEKFEVKENLLYINGIKYLDFCHVKLIGEHNYFNIAASLALVKALEIDINNQNTLDAIKNFNPIEHRMQLVLVYNRISIIDDSKGTNVGAVLSGVSGLKYKVHLILGGDGKGQNFYPLRNLVQQQCKSVAIIGKDRHIIFNILQDLNIKIELFDSMQDAVTFCFNNALPDEAIVLSPACSSLDMFDDYKHRSKVFIESVYANIK